jgi:anti-sigma regulatory factor (Ser/Thr protein kinase)
MFRLRGPLVRWRVPRQTGASGRARKAVRTTLTGWGWDEDRVAAVVLVASELLTNAQLHTDGDVALALRRTRHGVRLSVTDTDPRMPTRRDTGPEHEGGFGLHILDTTTTDWGARAHRTGKTVWADIDALRPDTGRRPWSARTRSTTARVRAVLGQGRRTDLATVRRATRLCFRRRPKPGATPQPRPARRPRLLQHLRSPSHTPAPTMFRHISASRAGRHLPRRFDVSFGPDIKNAIHAARESLSPT